MPLANLMSPKKMYVLSITISSENHSVEWMDHQHFKEATNTYIGATLPLNNYMGKSIKENEQRKYKG